MTDTNTEDKPTLDLAQRIAAALARTDEARPNPSTMERRENDIELGIVPLHLRHLHNLLVECERGEHEVLHRLFFQALDEHLTATDVQLYKKKLLPDWTILGVPDDGRSSSGMPDGLVMLHIGGLSDGREEGGLFDFLFGGGRRGRSRH